MFPVNLRKSDSWNICTGSTSEFLRPTLCCFVFHMITLTSRSKCSFFFFFVAKAELRWQLEDWNLIRLAS